jgi:hypothetical protein
MVYRVLMQSEQVAASRSNFESCCVYPDQHHDHLRA